MNKEINLGNVEEGHITAPLPDPLSRALLLFPLWKTCLNLGVNRMKLAKASSESLWLFVTCQDDLL